MTLEQYIEKFDELSRKEMTKIFNEFDVSERIDFLSILPEVEKNKFIKDIRQQAVDDFWWHERKAILNGTSTRDWTPEQIENIMNISEKTGKMNTNAGKGLQIDENGIFLVDKNGNKSYYGHHMVDVSTHPEYAGDWRNIQALTYDEHYYGAHPNHDTITPTEGYYNFETGKTEVIDVTADGFSFDNTEYPPKKKCIFKSDEAMKKKYSNYDELTAGEQLALKNADLALESGDFKKFEAANSLAEKYNSKNFYDKIGLETDANIKKKYGILSDCDNADIIKQYQFYEYASQHGYDIDVTVYVDENGKVIATSLDKDYVPKETDYKVSMEESLTLSEEQLKQRIVEMEAKDSQAGADSGGDKGTNVADGSEEIKDADNKKVEEVKGADSSEDGQKVNDNDIIDDGEKTKDIDDVENSKEVKDSSDSTDAKDVHSNTEDGSHEVGDTTTSNDSTTNQKDTIGNSDSATDTNTSSETSNKSSEVDDVFSESNKDLSKTENGNEVSNKNTSDGSDGTVADKGNTASNKQTATDGGSNTTADKAGIDSTDQTTMDTSAETKKSEYTGDGTQNSNTNAVDSASKAESSDIDNANGNKHTDLDIEKNGVDTSKSKTELSDKSKKFINDVEDATGSKIDTNFSSKTVSKINKALDFMDKAGDVMDLVDAAKTVYDAGKLFASGNEDEAGKLLRDYGFSTLGGMALSIPLGVLAGAAAINPILALILVGIAGYYGSKMGEVISDLLDEIFGLYVKPQIISGKFRRLFKAETPVTFCG